MEFLTASCGKFWESVGEGTTLLVGWPCCCLVTVKGLTGLSLCVRAGMLE